MQSYRELPSVLIQDPLSECAYLIGADRLREHKMSPEKLVYVDDGVITFSIPEDEFIEPTPPFNATRTSTPAVIVQFEAGQTAYFLTYNDLQEYRVDQPSEYGGYGISFVIPVANEFLEKLSPVQYASLQSGEGGMSTGIGGGLFGKRTEHASSGDLADTKSN